MSFEKGYWFSSKISAQLSEINNFGMFAKEEVQFGEVLVRAGGKIVSYLERHKIFEKNYSYIEVPESNNILIMGSETSFRATYLNHSCDPNLDFIFPEWRANRFIMAGSEVTCDYSTLGYHKSRGTLAIAECSCGSKHCRRKIYL